MNKHSLISTIRVEVDDDGHAEVTLNGETLTALDRLVSITIKGVRGDQIDTTKIRNEGA